MTTKTKSADDAYEQNAEASLSKGVQRKGTKPPPAGKVKVTHTRKGLGLSILDKVQLVYVTAAGIGGMVQLHGWIVDPTYQAHAMWAFGLATVVALLPCFLRKRE